MRGEKKVVNYSENNVITLVGKIASERRFSHEVYGEGFYIFDLEVPRLSDNSDIIPVTVSERILSDEYQIGTKIKIDGQFRSYNNYENEKNKLVLTVFVKDIKLFEEGEDDKINPNEIILNGFICKKPIYRTTPFGREISDILLAVNRAYNKSDYIPCIAWGRNARYCQNLEVGENIKLWGRIQSRQYEKKFEDGTSEIRRAYEVSVSKMEIEKTEKVENAIRNEAEETNALDS
ncbi:MAG: single-stranded DNA-binding protein [Clostridia bacterium]|nr:single-stranded DNA-binding protein [Clostridia bacterium]